MRFALNVLFVTSRVTNWMTATGIALIAGGLATLICFRRVLWTGRGRAGTERRPTRTRSIKTPRRPQLESNRTVLPVQAGAPEISGAHFTAQTAPETGATVSRRRRRGRSDQSGSTGHDLQRDDDERAGLASIGLADEDPVGPEEDLRPSHPVVDSVNRSDVNEPSVPVLEPRGDKRSDPPTGDYWMPVPESAYADLDPAGYGWPGHGDRDPVVESEPTAVVPTWPPARPFDRIELPRSWSEGPGGRTLGEPTSLRWNEADRNGIRRRGYEANDEVSDRHRDQLDRDGRHGWQRNSGPEEEHLALRTAEPRRRPRPRPNPTVYVSRHAAE